MLNFEQQILSTGASRQGNSTTVSIRLFTLGVFFGKDSYGYELKETAQLWGLPRWADIQEGSIYHALGKLEAEGLIAQRRGERPGNARVRHIYRITEAGRAAFLDLLRETCRSAPVEKRDMDIALAFLHFLPPEERIALLQERQAGLHTARAALLKHREETHRLHPNLSPWVNVVVEHSLGRLELEIEWNKSLLHTVGAWPQRHGN